jgi:hypothetical protein
MNAKFAGSTQSLLRLPDVVHSRLSMASAEHQCVFVAADAVRERGEARWVELQLHERRPGTRVRAARRVRVGSRLARQQRRGVRVADRHRDPRRDRQLEPVRHVLTRMPGGRPGQRIGRQALIEGEVVARARPVGQEPNRRLIVADVVAVVLEPAVIGCRADRCTPGLASPASAPDSGRFSPAHLRDADAPPARSFPRVRRPLADSCSPDPRGGAEKISAPPPAHQGANTADSA